MIVEKKKNCLQNNLVTEKTRGKKKAKLNHLIIDPKLMKLLLIWGSVERRLKVKPGDAKGVGERFIPTHKISAKKGRAE